MISYLKGTVEIKARDYIVVDVNGIGYKVFMTDKEISDLEQNQKIKVFTFLRVREDDISLYGFLSNEELMMFELLIGVGGIGAKTATGILSNITPSQFAMAVITNDVITLKKLPGIGAKSAERIILELRDKIKTEDTIPLNGENNIIQNLTDDAQDAIDALQVLGYSKRDIEKSFSKVNLSNLTTEEIIKKGLEILG